MRILTVQKNDAGQRLDKFLSKAVRGLPQSLMYKFIRTKKIKVNRARCEQSQILSEGDEIRLFIKDEFFEAASKDVGALSAITPKLDIVYEDEHILLLNKRPGVLVHDDAEGGENTLIMHVQAYLCGKGEYDPASEQSFAPALCNRIDRNTGGMVIAAKDAESLRQMNELIREDELTKCYLCLVHGHLEPSVATLHGYLRKDATNNMVEVRDRAFPGAKEIITKYRVLGERALDGEVVSLLEVELVTGRTHQIRAHMAHIGHPLVGDGKYGVNRDDRRAGFKYQALYAYRLGFKLTQDAGVLDYLRGKEFVISPADIWFTAGFDLSGKGVPRADERPVRAPDHPAAPTHRPAPKAATMASAKATPKATTQAIAKATAKVAPKSPGIGSAPHPQGRRSDGKKPYGKGTPPNGYGKNKANQPKPSKTKGGRHA